MNREYLIKFGHKVIEACQDNPDWSMEELADDFIKSINVSSDIEKKCLIKIKLPHPPCLKVKFNCNKCKYYK